MELSTTLTELTDRDWTPTADGPPLRVAVVGLGEFARERAIPAITESRSCELTLVVSGTEAKRAELSAARDVAAISYSAYHDGAGADSYDAVYVATPNGRHLPMATTAARLGKHVLCEKPLEKNPDRAGRLVDACADAGVTLMTAYRMQCHPTIRRLRTGIEDGLLGDPVFVHGNYSFSAVRDHRMAGHWRYDRALSGGGALMDIGVYPLNTTRYLLDAEPTAVTASTYTGHEIFADVDEHVSVQATFPDGLHGSFSASFNAQGDSSLQIVGTDGMVRLGWAFAANTDRELTVAVGHSEADISIPRVNEIIEQFERFAHCIHTGTTPDPDGRDGLRDVQIMDAVYRAADDGVRVSLGE